MLLRLLSEILSRKRTLRETFTGVYDRNVWGANESRSGSGSGTVETRVLRRELPALVRKLGIKTMLDAPCGDFFWMKDIVFEGVDYVGVDIVSDVVGDNERLHGGASKRFSCVDLTRDALPRSDLILCRDCLVHMTFEHARAVVSNFKRSGATYLLTTTFDGAVENRELLGAVDWRPLNLELEPFNFKPPLAFIHEGQLEWGGRNRTKSLGLWRLADLP